MPGGLANQKEWGGIQRKIGAGVKGTIKHSQLEFQLVPPNQQKTNANFWDQTLAVARVQGEP